MGAIPRPRLSAHRELKSLFWALVSPKMSSVSLEDMDRLLTAKLQPIYEELRQLRSEIASMNAASEHPEDQVKSVQRIPDETPFAWNAQERSDNIPQRRQQQRAVLGRRQDEPVPLLSIGNTVRVKTKEGQSAKSMITYIEDHEDPTEVEVEIDRKDGGVEDLVVRHYDVSELEAFERRSDRETTALLEQNSSFALYTLKDEANILFKLKDYVAAAEHYSKAIDFLSRRQSPFVVFSCGGSLVAQTVTWVGSSAKAGERQIEASQVVNVHDVNAQTPLYLNRARAYALLQKQQLAAQDLTMAIAIWDHFPNHPERPAKLCKAYYLRARSRLARNKFEAARQDCQACWQLEAPDTSSLLRQLERDIEVQQQEFLRSNKKIAKEVAKWADSAFSQMETS